MFNVDTGGTVGISNLWNDGGLFPNGFTGVLSALILVLFAFGGTEIIGVTASEAEDPEKTIPKAINTVPMRILLFYVLAIFVIVAVIPWREITGEQSPFVQIFSSLGIGWAAALLNVVVLSAALSAINSDLYGAGRVIHGMARQKLAPKMFAKIDPRNGVPVSTISALLIVLVIGVVLQLINPTAERLFQDIAALATFATIFVRLMIHRHLAYAAPQPEDVAHAIHGAAVAAGPVLRDRHDPADLRHDVLDVGFPLRPHRGCGVHGGDVHPLLLHRPEEQGRGRRGVVSPPPGAINPRTWCGDFL